MQVLTPPFIMEFSLLTAGQIAKRQHISLKEVYIWCVSVRKLFDVWGRSWGIIPIKNDEFSRLGMPEEIVEKFPNLPTQDVVDKYQHFVK